MSETIRMFIDGTSMIFNPSNIKIKRHKQTNTLKELRIAKARLKQGSLHRSIDKIKRIKEAALSE